MKCVQCGQRISTTKCSSCGFEHAGENVYFLNTPDEKEVIMLDVMSDSDIITHGIDLDTQYRRGMEAFSKGDYTQAIQWLKSSAGAGNRNAQSLLGYLYEVSVKCYDEEKSVFWYREAASRGDISAIRALTRYYIKHDDNQDRTRYWKQKLEEAERR